MNCNDLQINRSNTYIVIYCKTRRVISLAVIKRRVFDRDVPEVKKSWCSCNQPQQTLAREDVLYQQSPIPSVFCSCFPFFTHALFPCSSYSAVLPSQSSSLPFSINLLGICSLQGFHHPLFPHDRRILINSWPICQFLHSNCHSQFICFSFISSHDFPFFRKATPSRFVSLLLPSAL